MPDIYALDGRSVAEANLYMDIRGCAPGWRGHRIVLEYGVLLSVYECKLGDQWHTFRFRVLDDPLAVEGFGGEEPSRIICPGEFLLHAQELAERVPATTKGMTARQVRAGNYYIERAVECLKEVFKFIPASEEFVPQQAFSSKRGLEAFQASSGRLGRFGRLRLEAVLSVYQSIATEYAKALLS